MATYVIGDVHGCFDQLQMLLDLVHYDPSKDDLWFTGDLINGGPKPVEVLRFIKALDKRQICVLGNHDLTLLSIGLGKNIVTNDRINGFEPVLHAPDSHELLNWLQMRPLVHFDQNFNVLLVHAGVLPLWNIEQILSYANEVQHFLRTDDRQEFYMNMFGNLPDTWDENLVGWPRIRFLVNCFTRMRFCTAAGKLDLTSKGSLNDIPAGFSPWFMLPNARPSNLQIIFGHWSALLGKTQTQNMLALDTGCVWGNYLTALCLEDLQRYSIANH